MRIARSRSRERGNMSSSSSELWSIRPLRVNDWSLIEELFGDNGACGGCWCMSWRIAKHGQSWEASKGARNKRRLRKLVEGSEVNAVLAINCGEPIGWCSFGPRDSFPRIANMPSLQRETVTGTWSIVCFFICPAWRRKGLGIALLKAATDRAFQLGAREIEGFPVVPWNPAVHVPPPFAWTGLLAQFKAVGYSSLKRQGFKRPIYVLARSDGVQLTQDRKS
jgi:GNAT superfamily N-acetyltransferase